MNTMNIEVKDMTIWQKVKKILKFIWRYLVNFWYGLKGRILSLFRFTIGIWPFIKSLFKLPIEAWNFTKMDMKDGII